MPNLNLQSGSYSVANWTTGDGANPTASETITIGTDIYEWGGVGVNINVAIGAGLSASVENLVDAIEANSDEDIDFWNDAGILYLLPIDDNDDYVIAGALPALAASQAADPWSFYTGEAGGGQVASGVITMTAAMVSRAFTIELPFTPSRMILQWFDSGGVVRSTITATAGPTAGRLEIDPTAGGVNPVATDILVWVAWE